MKITDKTKKVVAAVVAVLFLSTIILPITMLFVDATPLTQQQRADTKNKAQSIIDQSEIGKNDVLTKKKILDDEVGELEISIASLNKSIAALDDKIYTTVIELEEAEIAVEVQYETYKERLKVMYMEGSGGYLDALLQSDSLTDFLNRFEIIGKIAEYDSNMLDKLEALRQEIEDKKIQLENDRSKKVDEVNEVTAQKVQLNAKRAEANALIRDFENTIEEQKKVIKEMEAIDAEEARLRAEATGISNGGPAQYVGGSMEWPTPGYYTVTSEFGPRFHPVLKVNRHHSGTDIGAPSGAKIVAMNDGTVVKSVYSSSYGNYVVINHGGGIQTLYAHASSLSVSAGQTVTRGQEVARVGSTGYSTGPHLHFEVIINGSNVNPMGYFR